MKKQFSSRKEVVRHALEADSSTFGLKLSHYYDSLRIVSRRHKVALRHFAPLCAQASTSHCLILHGWASDARALQKIRQHLQDLPQAATWNFWDISYDTTWQSFPESARQIMSKLNSTGHNFSRTLLIGYSMGGLVARQLVAEGFPCSDLITLCSPHHGPVNWMPIPLRGPRSLGQWSQHLRALDRQPHDIAQRNHYHFFGITYSDSLGFHSHDGMVSKSSALGEKLGAVATRHTIQLRYSTPVSMLMPIDPHWRGMFPQYVGPALQHIGILLADNIAKKPHQE